MEVNLSCDEILCKFSALYNESLLTEKIKANFHNNVHKPWINMHDIIIPINTKTYVLKIMSSKNNPKAIQDYKL